MSRLNALRSGIARLGRHLHRTALRVGQQRQWREGEVIGQRFCHAVFDVPQRAGGEERLGTVLFDDKGPAARQDPT